MSAQLSLLAEVEGVPPHVISKALGGSIARTFALMDTAERVIAERWPGRGAAPLGAFSACRPTEPVFASDMLAEAHMREMCGRLAAGESLETLTRAEVVGLLLAASLRHPLKHHDLLVYETLFAEVFPDALAPLDHGDTYGEATMSEVRATIAEWLARKSPERSR